MPPRGWDMCHMSPRPRSKPVKPGSIDLGAFALTKATVTRPASAKFDPAYRMSERSHAAIRAIERGDHELARLAPSRRGILERIRREALVRNAFATASIEGNPLITWLMSVMGEGPGLATAKVTAGFFGMLLHLSAVHKAVAILAGFYIVVAIIPWLAILYLV